MLDNVLKAMKRELLEDIRNILREELQQFKAETPKPSDELLDTRSVCALLKVTRPTLARLVRENHIEAIRLGGGSIRRFKRSAVERALINIKYLKHARKPL
jgi:excisionase family DNA binding protein